MTKEMFPDLSAAEGLTVDIETYDPDLVDKGPGVRRNGYVLGVGIATFDEEFKRYYPIAHAPGGNLPKDKVYAWLSRELSRPDQPLLGVNILYDLDYLTHDGVLVGGLFYDIQNAEPLIDENQLKYSLEVQSQKYLGLGKNEEQIQRICDERGWKGKPQTHLWRMKPEEVDSYVMGDITNPSRIFRKQKDILLRENLWDLFLLETRLVPLLLQMRQVGVRIDEERLDNTIKESEEHLLKVSEELTRIAGKTVEIWAAEQIATVFDKLGLEYKRTDKTDAPSFTRTVLEKCPHPIGKVILEARRLDKFVGTFLKGQIKDQLIDGRIHCQFNQLRSDDYGTVTGRFSSSNPNLQFMPARDDVLGPVCRSMFIPEEGHLWGKADYSQIELRILAHYAVGPGAEDIRNAYRENPHIDFHDWCAGIADTTRQKAKIINFGIPYGMGKEKLTRALGGTLKETEEFLKKYHAKIPFTKETLREAARRAERRGHIFTILKRRRRFDMWEPCDWNFAHSIHPSKDRNEMIKIVHDEMIRREETDDSPIRPGVRRANTYKALNALIQGSAADLMKKAMVDSYEAGLFKPGWLIPHITVHDELDPSVPKGEEGEKMFQDMCRMMEESIKFSVPIIVDGKLGENWGALH